MKAIDVYLKVEVDLDDEESPKRFAEELCRALKKIYGVRRAEISTLLDVSVETEEFDLLFRSAREFFFAPVIEYGPLPQWKEIAGKGETMQEIFWHIKEAIDAYFGDRAFEITVKAGCIRATRPLEATIAAATQETVSERVAEQKTLAPSEQNTADRPVHRDFKLDDEDEDTGD